MQREAAGGLPDRHVAAAAGAIVACVAALAWSFGLGEQVPLLSAVDLGFHELGHMLGAWLPGLLPVLSGTFLQLAVPIGLAVYFGVVRSEGYAAALMLAWAGTSARDVSVYIADAPYEALPLIGGTHDWAYILGANSHLDWAAPLAAIVWWSGVACVLGGIVVGSLAVWQHLANGRRVSREREIVATLPRREPRNPVIRGLDERADAPPSVADLAFVDDADPPHQ